MLVVDFDGTLLRSDDTVADDDLIALTELGDRGVLRVIATGRSAFSYRRAMGDLRLPVDRDVQRAGVDATVIHTAELLVPESVNVSMARVQAT